MSERLVRTRHFARRLIQLYGGLFLFGFAAALMLRAGFGVDPWTVFAEGLSHHTGIGVGWMVLIIGLCVLVLWIPLRQMPGVGTVFNALLVGPSMEVGLWLIETPDSVVLRAIMFATGLLMTAIASGFYIGAGFGPGPRDGLMTGANARFGWPIWIVRTTIEVVVVTIGWLLGGSVGVGTLVFALTIGPLVQPALRALRTPR